MLFRSIVSGGTTGAESVVKGIGLAEVRRSKITDIVDVVYCIEEISCSDGERQLVALAGASAAEHTTHSVDNVVR